MADNPTLGAALAYLRRGWSVFPCLPGDKRPDADLLPKEAGEDGRLRATWAPFQREAPTEAQVREWWRRRPAANVAIVTGAVSGLVVLDLDRGHGDGADGLASLRAADLDLPETRCVRTPSGGLHAYFRHPGHAVPNAAGLHGLAGVDVRGDGGYVVAPPSTTAAGAYIAEERTRGLPFAELPAWVMRGHGAGSRSRRPANEWAAAWASPCPQGQRNTTCARLAGHLAAHGHDEAEAAAVLSLWAGARCAPPLADAEVEQTVSSVYRTDQRRDPSATISPAPEADASDAFDALPSSVARALASEDPAARCGGAANALRGGMSPECVLACLLAKNGGDATEARRALAWAMRRAEDRDGRRVG